MATLYYALRLKTGNPLKLFCISKNQRKHHELVASAKQYWEGIQPRGTNGKYFDNVERVYVTVETHDEYKQRLLDEAKAEAEINTK